jgi:hypothetical protein
MPKKSPDNIAFFVSDKPFCLWSPSPTLDEINAQTIEGIRPEFFIQRSTSLLNTVDDIENTWAAMSLRSDYGHAIESMLALLFASIQAPRCLAGWLNLYRRDDLEELCARVVNGKNYPHMLLKLPDSWRKITEHVVAGAPDVLKAENGVSTTREELCDGASIALEKIVDDFLDPLMRSNITDSNMVIGLDRHR